MSPSLAGWSNSLIRITSTPGVSMPRRPLASNMLDIPDHLEEVFLVRGPRVFDWLVVEAGGIVKASEITGAACATLSRWMNAKPGELFGPRKDARSYRSMWFGYPTPFPGLDRIVEEIEGEHQSFIRMSVEKRGFRETLRWMRGSRGFGLEMLDLNQAAVLSACESIGVPVATRRRWHSGLKYPVQWRHLDTLSAHVTHRSWLETVISVSLDIVPRRVSKSALRCMILDAMDVS
jgi:hypothetical protein